MTIAEIVRSMSEERQRHIWSVLSTEDSATQEDLLDEMPQEELELLINLLKAEERRRKAVNAELAASAAQECRLAFPERFAGCSDQEVLGEIAVTVQQARAAGVTV